MAPEELCYMPISRLAPLLRRRALSPVEVAQAYLERAGALQPLLNAYITLTPEEALRQARQAEAEMLAGGYRGPLHGVPLALKDLFATRGVRTTAGSPALGDWVPQEDAHLVGRLREAGAVFLGKLNMHEWAWGVTNRNPHYGDCRNPWDPSRTPGGSSGGSGAAVAAGACAGSLGSDTGGSIRIPSAYCGIVGLKPTYGLCSRRGVVPLSWSVDHLGPMARTVEDAAILLQAIAGHDPQDPGSARVPVPNYRRGLRRGVKGLRLGVLADPYFRVMEPEVEGAFQQALRQLEALGAELEEVSLPLAEAGSAANSAIVWVEASALHQRRLAAHPHLYSQEVREALTAGLAIPATAYVKAQQVRRLVGEQLAGLLRRVDLLALPATPIAAHPLEQEEVLLRGERVTVLRASTRYMGLFNLTGLPALSVPCGFTPEGLPVGLQLVGRPFAEADLLRVAWAYEQATPWHRRRPGPTGTNSTRGRG